MLGIGYHEFWSMTPRIIKVYAEAYNTKRKHLDEEMWSMGMYVQRAVEVGVGGILLGKKFKETYFKEPMLSSFKPDTPMLSEEEKYEREVQKAINEQDAWIFSLKQHGLPETVI